jgi:hypothetical protein
VKVSEGKQWPNRTGTAAFARRFPQPLIQRTAASRQERTFPTRQLLAVVMPIAGLAGGAAQIPAGTLIDAGKAKHGLVFAAAIVVTTACLTLQLFPQFWLVGATQAVVGASGAVFAPAIVAITLGIVGPRAFPVMAPSLYWVSIILASSSRNCGLSW